jgi:prophage regulatory protein
MPNHLKEVTAPDTSNTQPLEQSQRDELYALLSKVVNDPALIRALQENITLKAKPEVHIIRMDELSKRLGLAKSTLYQMIAGGRFPKPFSINGGKAAGWLTSTVDQWLEERAAVREGGLR